MKIERTIRTIVFALAFIVLSFSSVVTVLEEVTAYIPHAPISINGNGDFTASNGVTGGSGTLDDPFVITGWEIPIATGRAIYIENATVHFRIEDVYIHGATSGPGIYFLRSSNGTVTNSLLENNFVSVFLWFTENITVSATSITGFEIGIRVANSSNVTVSGVMFESDRRLVDIRGSTFISLYNNTASGGGVFIDGSLKEHFNTHEMAWNNTIRGKPIVYIKNYNDLTLDATEAAQVILANCSRFRLLNLSITGTETALELAFVQNGLVSSGHFSKTYVGILQLYTANVTYSHVTISEASYQAARIRYSDFTRFSYSTIRSSHEGIVLSFSNNFTVRDSTFLSIMGSGISSMYSSDIQLENSSFQEMMYGLNHWSGDILSVLWNEFTYIETAVEMSRTNDSIVMGNSFAISGRALWLDRFRRGTISENTVYDIRIRGFEIWYVTNTTCNKNRINHVLESGILMVYSANNTLRENSIIGSLAGIGILNSKSNRIHHNNLINNSIQAYDSSSNDNEWDDGYPSGGNYWSNYTGPDDFTGPGQDIPGSDGIRDIPFDFDPDTKDDYPLMTPVVAIPPDAPRNLTAHLSGKELENVTLSWNLSIDDLNGQRSVLRYDILRGRNYSSDLFGYVSYASVPKGASQYIDIGAGEGDPDNYFYVICAIDSNGNSSCSHEQAGKFTRRLTERPNLVSIPLLQANTTTEHVLQTVKCDKAWYYSALSQEWQWYVTHKSYRRGLWHINHTMGVWLNVTRESNLTVAGIVPTQTVIYLREGWNLASFPSFATLYTISDLKAEVGATRVEGYESVSPYYLRVLGDAETLQSGYGYWARVETDTVWIVEDS